MTPSSARWTIPVESDIVKGMKNPRRESVIGTPSEITTELKRMVGRVMKPGQRMDITTSDRRIVVVISGGKLRVVRKFTAIKSNSFVAQR